MMKQIVLFIFLLLPLCSFANENDFGTVKGKITTSDNRPAAAVTIVIKSAHRTIFSNDDGTFTISRLAAGQHQLEVSLIGYKPLLQDVTVEKNKVTTITLQLEVSSTQLKEISITSGRNKFARKESEQIARLPIRNLENPQVYSVAGKALIEEQLITERTDLYRNIPGAVPNFAAGGSQGMTIRGFSNGMGMRNGMVTSAIVPLNPIMLERVEVIKGPSGTLFGSNRNVTFGGVFNYVTKKPYDSFGGEVGFTGGSFKFGRVTADVNTPLNKDKTLLFRLNAAAQSEGSFQDQGYAKNYTIAPSITYQVNDKLKFSLDIDVTRGNYTTTSFAIDSMSKVTARNFKDLPIDYNRSYINSGVDISNGINNIQAQMEYKLSDEWTSQTNYLYSDGFYKDLLWTTLSMVNDSTLARTVRNQTPETFGNIQVQQNFIGDFHIGSFRNRVVIGLDYNYNYNELYRVTVPYDKVNINQPLPDISAEKINALSYQRGFAGSTTKAYNYSAYISDVFNITPTLMAMLSLRTDRYSTKGQYAIATGKYTGEYQQNSLSPKFGLVYQVVKDKVSLFGNYMNGFVNLAPVTQPDNTVLVLDPQFGNQWEGGVKVDILDGKLNGSLSYYNISVSNSTRTEVIDGKNFTVQNGTQNSKGFEAEVIANPIPGLNIIAGYAFNENKYTKASPALEGKFITASPQNVANIWVSYTTKKGLGLGIGGNYVSDSWFESTNVFVLPAYTLLNATVFYDQPKYRLSLKGNNLLDQQYWNPGGTPQKQLNFLASIAFKF
ncbi:TonB-dependent siderophore receptor [Chitinophaga sp. SYP-B3965]|uniref:TonB-dependent receptor n=1 Tax=Chitinophaga sp. SYP-B3965 TaxID=2663120 RepID=UPI001299FC0C|nr:TonB-dependent receptor [Chitinophaga sp. SYP-B3965]MRG44257.1 TonB-dependent siderophore receptor [Chitinophaga sp. SYP-B3965]